MVGRQLEDGEEIAENEDDLPREANVTNSKVWIYGTSRKGHIPISIRPHDTPQEIKSLSDKEVTQISAGEHHMAVATKTGEVFIWGTSPGTGFFSFFFFFHNSTISPHF